MTDNIVWESDNVSNIDLKIISERDNTSKTDLNIIS
jgi:hypothetical protein